MSRARPEELAANLAQLERRLTAACRVAGRDRDEVTLVAVTKTFPVSDIEALATLGVRDIGENRDQEASAKARELIDLAVTWHFVGQLQANKCRSIASYADVVHTLDRTRVVEALDAGAGLQGRTIDALIQVRLDEDPARGGAPPAVVAALADQVATRPHLRLRGVMAVAPRFGDPRPAFDRLARVAADVRSAHPGANLLSAGMSGDLEAAVAAGATHVRVGTALLGGRAPRFG